MQPGDEILKINGKTIRLKSNINRALQNSNGQPVDIIVKRNSEIININLIPTEVKEEEMSYYVIGVVLDKAERSAGGNVYYAFWDTADFTFSVVDNLKMLFTGKVSADQLMGPIGISEVVAKTDGLKEFIYILALISLSLGVTNLLPFPPLDGGKIVILLVEAARGKPLKESVEVGIQTVGFVLIILLSIFVAYNDVLRIF